MKQTITLLLLFLAATLLVAQAPSRVLGNITNSAGEPIADVKITVEDQKVLTNVKHLTSNEKGTYRIAVTDGTHTYLFTLEKEGYIKWQEVIKPIIFNTLEHDFVLKTLEETNEIMRQKNLEANPHLASYEEGRIALLDEKLDEAEAAFLKVLELEPDYYQANLALSNIYFKKEKFDKAEVEALKVIAEDEESIPAHIILIGCAKHRGDDAKVQEYQVILDELQPDSPESLYNSAASLINERKDAEAIKKLEEAVELNPEFTKAYFELGFCYMRLGEMDKAKEYLQKYIDKDPDGDKVNDAKEAMKWL